MFPHGRVVRPAPAAAAARRGRRPILFAAPVVVVPVLCLLLLVLFATRPGREAVGRRRPGILAQPTGLVITVLVICEENKRRMTSDYVF